MLDMMKKLQEAQRQMKEIKDRLDTITVEGTSPQNAVKVQANGNRKILGITFANEDALSDPEHLEDLLVMAINDAIEKADKVNESEMKSVAGSMMPGLGGMFK